MEESGKAPRAGQSRGSGRSSMGGKGERLSEKMTFKLTAESFKRPSHEKRGEGGIPGRGKCICQGCTPGPRVSGHLPPLVQACLFLEGLPSAWLTTTAIHKQVTVLPASKEFPPSLPWQSACEMDQETLFNLILFYFILCIYLFGWVGS